MYKAVEVVEPGSKGETYGYAIVQDPPVGDGYKFTSVHLIETLEEAEGSANWQNELDDLYQFWPTSGEPEVRELVADPEFEPHDMEEVDTIDWKNSKLVYVHDVPRDEPSQPVMNQDGEPVINYDESEIVYKKITVPKSPAERAYRARLEVARKRKEAASAETDSS